MNKKASIYIAGHGGLVGSAILAALEKGGYENILMRSSKELNLTNQEDTHRFFEKHRPEYVFLAAAKVGGIYANNVYRADFLYPNVLIPFSVLSAAQKYGVKKLVFISSACIYPKDPPQPIKEGALLTSPLEYTNEPHAIAKLAANKLCEAYNLQYGTNFLIAMPSNLYGIRDNFDLETSHVLPALFRKIYLGRALEGGDWGAIANDIARYPMKGLGGNASKEEMLKVLAENGIEQGESGVSVTLWGDGTAKREFLWAGDFAKAALFLMEKINFGDLHEGGAEVRNTHINIGSGEELSIKALALLIKDVLGFGGAVCFDADKPNGVMRRFMNIEKMTTLGWKAETPLKKGIAKLAERYGV